MLDGERVLVLFTANLFWGLQEGEAEGGNFYRVAWESKQDGTAPAGSGSHIPISVSGVTWK